MPHPQSLQMGKKKCGEPQQQSDISPFPPPLQQQQVIRVGTPQKYKPTESSEFPKPRKIRPTKIANRVVLG